MTNTYYTYEIPTAEGETKQETNYYPDELAEAMSMLKMAAQMICFADCTDERLLSMYVQGREVRYCGWQPGMVFRFIFADNGDTVAEFCFPSWSH